MAELRGTFAANREEVAAKVIDGELIVIRLSDGTYYSMDNVGARVWELIEARRDLSSMARTIAGWYGAPIDRVEAEIAGLVEELVGERLVVAADGGPDPGPTASPAPADLPDYETPRLNVYRDMGNLLALDPPTPGIDDLSFKDGKAG
jgi:hypothetical protein